LIAAGLAFAETAPTWDRWQFLIGDWAGEGGGDPGQGAGAFSLKPDLDGRVLIRKNRSDYPATKDKPAYHHEDLMIVYPEGPAGHAIYFDNEGHVIHYGIEFGHDGGAVVFTSVAHASTPRFRLTYNKSGLDKVGIQFEIDVNGILHVLARDTKTGHDEIIELKSAVDVSDEAVEAMLADSLDHALADVNERIWTEGRLKSEEMLNALQSALAIAGEQLGPGEKEQIARAAAEVRAALGAGQLSQLKAANESLDLATQHLAALVVEPAMSGRTA
jgi:hypothetical protein